MSADGLTYLGRMARSVPKNGVIVEVGPLFGSSTWVLAKNAHPSVRVFSIDTWEPAPWIEKIEEKYRGCLPFSKQAFLHYIKDCPNVTAIQGWSPDVVKDWSLPIDMFFDDATHGDPGFSENVDFFLPFVKPGALLCGDDYSDRWPDIVSVVDRLGARWGTVPEVSGRVWALRNPNDQGASHQQILQNLPAGEQKPSITLTTQTRDGREYQLSNEVWSGALHKNIPLSSIQMSLEIPSGKPGPVKWYVTDSQGQTNGPLRSGRTYTCPQDTWITGYSVALVGWRALIYSVDYQASFGWNTGRGKRYSVSRRHKNGQHLSSNDARIAITAIKIKVSLRHRQLITKMTSAVSTLRFMHLRSFLEKTQTALGLRTKR